MPATSTVTASHNQDIDGILAGVKWTSTSLTYSFPTAASQYPANYSADNEPGSFSALNTTQQNAVRSILSMYSAVSNLTFTETTGGTGTLRFAESTSPDTAWGYYPANDSKGTGGDVWLNKVDYNSPVSGNYAWMTLIHEIGHTMGLKHGHETESGFPTLPASHDSVEYSVMTYAAYVGDPLTTGYAIEQSSYPSTLMQDDIAALQYMYGANFTTNNGNTVYKWSPTTGQETINGVAQAMPAGDHILMTIWDGGGVDTYDLSNYTTNLTIDLRPGAWSTFSTAQLSHLDQYTTNTHIAAGNLSNALLYNGDLRSLIENATGGTGNDSITGNQIDNVLNGGAGNDSLFGMDGNDTLIAGAGNNTLDGGNGFDTADYTGAPAIKSVNLTAHTLVNGYNGTDTLISIEDLLQRTNNADNSYHVQHWDMASQNTWSTYTADYDTQSRLTGQLYSNDDGTFQQYGWDPGGQFAWTDYNTAFDNAMHPTGAFTDYDDGSHIQLAWDVQNQASWTDFSISYDNALRRVSALVDNDDGSHTGQIYDPQNLYSWRDITIDYDSSNRRVDAQVNNDDGSRVWTTYDPRNVSSWEHYDQFFSPSGTLVKTAYHNDDGTTVIV